MVFPIELRAHETAHYTSSPHQYREAFLAAWRGDATRNQRDGWYAFDVTITNRTEVTFVAYDMRDFLSGGIGEVIWRGKATVPAKLTLQDVERAIEHAAAVRLLTERSAEDRRILAGYADQIRAALP